MISLMISFLVLLKYLCDRRFGFVWPDMRMEMIRLLYRQGRTLFAILFNNFPLRCGVFQSFKLSLDAPRNRKRMDFLIFISTTTTTSVHFSHRNPLVNTFNKFNNYNEQGKGPTQYRLAEILCPTGCHEKCGSVLFGRRLHGRFST